MADALFLRKGLLENLANAPYVEGSLNFTTDEPAIYLDVDGKHTRIGDIKEFADLEALEAYLVSTPGKIPTTGLYYAIAENALMKYTGTAWKRINEQHDFTDEIGAVANTANSALTAAQTAQEEVDALEQTHATDKAALEGSIGTVAGDLAGHIEAYDAKMTALDAKDSAHDTSIGNLQNSLNAEVDRAKAAEEANAKNISDLQTSKQNVITGAASSIVDTGLTKNRVLISSEDEKVIVSTITATELSSLSGIEGSLKTQLTTITDDIGNIKNNIGTGGTVDTKIATAKQEAIAAAEQKATELVNAEVSAREEAISDLEDAYKAADEALTGRVSTLEQANNTTGSAINGLTGRVADLEAADIAIRAEIESAAGQAVTDANDYTDDKIAEVRGNTTETVASVNGKVSDLTTTVGNNYNTLVGLIANEKTRAEGEEAKIRSEMETAHTELKTEITTEYEAYVDSKLQAADAMVFKGVANSASDLGTVGNTAGEKVGAGWTYKVGTNFELEGATVYVGDLLIAKVDQGDSATYTGGWDHVASGYEDDHDVHLEVDGASAKLVNAAGQKRGSIAFEAATGTNLVVSVSEVSKDAQSGVTDMKVSLTLEWGSF